MKENDKHTPFSILKHLYRLGFIIILLMVINSRAPATVSGPCSNCHTMHNSQDGSAMATTADPMENLLVNSCVGCHSSTGSETIVDLNGSQIPIVYNTGAYPANPLAGGNFYHVANDDAYGHNVWGISDQDAILTQAPGNTQSCGGGGGTATGCHFSLAVDPALNNTAFATGKNGCEGCHQHVKHHSLDPVSGDPETAESGWFRGLGGHYGGANAMFIPGIESDDWEHTPSVTNHNVYSGRDDNYERFTSGSQATITVYCTGCHEKIHYHQDDMMNNTDSPWIRHPTDRLLPETGEYSVYNPVDAYDPTVPVGWTDITTPTRATAVVICLSCHRAHGSQYPDMLRWDYEEMVAGDSAATDSGCFVCHSTKDE